jgi:hypothetical protein
MSRLESWLQEPDNNARLEQAAHKYGVHRYLVRGVLDKAVSTANRHTGLTDQTASQIAAHFGCSPLQALRALRALDHNGAGVLLTVTPGKNRGGHRGSVRHIAFAAPVDSPSQTARGEQPDCAWDAHLYGHISTEPPTASPSTTQTLVPAGAGVQEEMNRGGNDRSVRNGNPAPENTAAPGGLVSLPDSPSPAERPTTHWRAVVERERQAARTEPAHEPEPAAPVHHHEPEPAAPVVRAPEHRVSAVLDQAAGLLQQQAVNSGLRIRTSPRQFTAHKRKQATETLQALRTGPTGRTWESRLTHAPTALLAQAIASHTAGELPTPYVLDQIDAHVSRHALALAG